MVLDFIEKYKFAIIGTVMFHVAFFIFTNFAYIQRPYKLVEAPTETLIPLDDIPLDPEMLKILELKQNIQPQSEEVYNVTSDANDTRDKSYDDYSTQEVTPKDAEYYKNLENQFLDDAKQTNSGLIKKENPGVDIKKQDDKKNITNNNNPDETIDSDGNKAFAGDVMASFNLEGRKVHSLEKPGYTCNNSGTVVLQIKVNNDGTVQSVTYQPAGSSNATECLIQQSIKYAKRSRFNLSSSAPSPQTGTITYKFVSK